MPIGTLASTAKIKVGLGSGSRGLLASKIGLLKLESDRVVKSTNLGNGNKIENSNENIDN